MSNSSFLLLIEEKWFTECFTNLYPYDKHIIDQIAEAGEIFGIKCKIIEGWYSKDESYLIKLDDHILETVEPFKSAKQGAREMVVDTFIEKVSERKNKVYFYESDQI